MTLAEPVEIESMELGLGGVWITPAETCFEQRAGVLREFEGFGKALSGRHAAEDREIAVVIGSRFRVHFTPAAL